MINLPLLSLFLAFLCLASCENIYLTPPLYDKQVFFWSQNSSWTSPPTPLSCLFLMGRERSPVIVVDVIPQFYSIYASNVTIRFEIVFHKDVQLSGTVTLDNVIIESNTEQSSVSFSNLNVDGSTHLCTNISVLQMCRLSTVIHLTSSSLQLVSGSELIIQEGSSPSGDIKAWGVGSDGRTGIGREDSSHSPELLDSSHAFCHITGGSHHSLGVTCDGRLYSWGSNEHGQLGRVVDDDSFSPTLVDLSDVVQVAANWEYSLARTRNGTVYSWGLGAAGRLGHGDEYPQSFPKRISELYDVVDISAGGDAGLATLGNGSVQVWGSNQFCQQGDGGEGSNLSPVLVPIDEPVLRAIGCQYHALFITQQGGLLSVGDNKEGKLCSGYLEPSQRGSVEPIFNYESFTVIQASCGQDYSVFLTQQGDVYSCGNVLGRSSSTPKETPGHISDLVNIRFIAGGRYQAFVIDMNNQVYSWDVGSSSVTLDPELSQERVATIDTGDYHFFMRSPRPPAVYKTGNSSILVDGVMRNNYDNDVELEADVVISSDGEFESNSGLLLLKSHILNSGIITSTGTAQVVVQSLLDLIGGLLSSDNEVVVEANAKLTGFGKISSDLQIRGLLQPKSQVLQITGDLLLTDSSELSLVSRRSETVKLVVNGDVTANGFISIDYSDLFLPPNFKIQPFLYNSFSSHSGILFDVICSSFFDIEITSAYLEVETLHQVLPYLGQVSYLSPLGTNEDCCGTYAMPCSSFSKIYERMGNVGTIYLFEGDYNEAHFDVDFINSNFTFSGSAESSPEIYITGDIRVFNSFINFSNFSTISISQLFFEYSNITFSHLLTPLTITSLYLVQSNLALNTSLPVLFGSLQLDSLSSVDGPAQYLNMYWLKEHVNDISEDCIDVDEYSIKFDFFNAELIDYFVDIQVAHSLDYEFILAENQFILVLRDIYPLDQSSSLLSLQFSAPGVNFLESKFLLICSPFIEQTVPSVYQFQDTIFIFGRNIFPRIEFLNLNFDLEVSLNIVQMNYSMIEVEIYNLCNISFTGLQVSVSNGHMNSNSFTIPILFPEYSTKPMEINPSVSNMELSLNTSIPLSILSKCNAVTIASNVDLDWYVEDPNIFILSFDLSGIYTLKLLVQLSEEFVGHISVPVIDFIVSPLQDICFTKMTCTLSVCVEFEHMEISRYVPMGSSFLHILNYLYSNDKCIEIFFEVENQAAIYDLQLCSVHICSSPAGLPDIVNVDHLTPLLVQWRFGKTQAVLTLEGQNFANFHQNDWKRTLCFNNHSIDLLPDTMSDTSLSFEVIFDHKGIFPFTICSFGKCENHFHVSCDDFLTAPPVFFQNSQLKVHSGLNFFSLPLYLGSQLVLIDPGFTSVFVGSNVPAMTLYSHIIARPITSDYVPNFVGLNVPFEFSIDLETDGNIFNASLHSLSDCHVYCNLHGRFLNISAVGVSIETCVFELKLTHSHSELVKRLEVPVVDNPAIVVTSKTNFVITEQVRTTLLIDFELSCTKTSFQLGVDGFSITQNFTIIEDRDDRCFMKVDVVLEVNEVEEPIHIVYLYCKFPVFGEIFVSSIAIFDITFEIRDSTVSILEPHNVIVFTDTILPSNSVCTVEDFVFDSIIGADFIICNDVHITKYSPFTLLSIKLHDTILGTVNVPVEPVFGEMCFVEEHVSLLKLVDISLSSGQSPALFDTVRCCSTATQQCFTELGQGGVLRVSLKENHVIHLLRVSTNSSCAALMNFSPISIANVSAGSWMCQSFLNGFEDAVVCSAEVNLVNVGELVFLAFESVQIYEIEVYGYKVTKCLKPINDFVGVTVLESEVEIDGKFRFQEFEFASLNYFAQFFIQNYLSAGILTDSVVLSYQFVSDDCYYPDSFFSKTIEPSSAQNISLIDRNISISPSDTFILRFECTDSNFLRVSCFPNVFDQSNLITESSFSHNNFTLYDTNMLFHSKVESGDHSICLNIVDSVCFEFTLYFEYHQEFVINSLRELKCDRDNVFYATCKMIHFDLILVTRNLFSIEHNSISLSQVDVSVPEDIIFSVLNGESLEVVGPPLYVFEILFHFHNVSTSFEVQLFNCDSTRAHFNYACYCKLGTYLSSFGACQECPLNSFRSIPLSDDCINCPIGRVTRRPGATNSSLCVCEESRFDSGDACIECPKYGTCSFGNFLSFSNGFRFTPEFGSVSCPFRYSCKNNECRFNTQGPYCSECLPGTILFGYVCVGNDFGYVLLSLVSLVFVISLLSVSQLLVNQATKRKAKIRSKLNRSMSSIHPDYLAKRIRYLIPLTCPFRIVMILSILFNGNIVLVTLPLSFAASLFGHYIGFLLFCLLIIAVFHLLKWKLSLYHNADFRRSFFANTCLISGFTGLISKLNRGIFDIEVIMLIPLLVFVSILIMNQQRHLEELFSTFAILILLPLTSTPFIIYSAFQTVTFLILFFLRSFLNVIPTAFGLIFSFIYLIVYRK
ncbi:hypothetical protein P9112_005191 [Eukaryota sp. TZLM1-RC]